MKNLISLVSTIILSTNLLFAQIINIPADYPTIQEGIDAAVDGDTVLVAPGTYYENIYNTKAIVLASWYLTTLDTSYVSQTIIDGNQNGPVIIFSCDWFISAQITGFTITNGNAYDGGGILLVEGKNMNLSNLVIKNNNANYGGGLFNARTELYLTDVKIINNSATFTGGGINIEDIYHMWSARLYANNITVKSNHAGGNGGGLNCLAGHISVQNSTFEDNSANWGGGICFRPEGTFYLNNVKILNNYAEGVGGGIYTEHSFPEFLNVEVGYNSSKYGGGMYISATLFSLPLKNILIHNNFAQDTAGGVFLNTSSPTFENVTVADNDASYARGIYCRGSRLHIENSIVYGDNPPQRIVFDPYGGLCSITISHSLIQGGEYFINTNDNGTVNWLEGNINQNPQFVNSGDYPYQINDNSPCVDAGSTDTTGITEFDLAGEPRFFNGRIDMGAYEWNTFVGLEEPIISSPNWNINIYPNPFTTTTTFSYTLQHPSTVHISIFNHLGEQVEVIRQEQSEGKQQVVWDAEGMPSGVYFYRMQAGDQVASGKMLLVK